MLFVARGEASEVFDPNEEPLDAIARPAEYRAEAGFPATMHHRGNIGRSTSSFDLAAQPVGVANCGPRHRPARADAHGGMMKRTTAQLAIALALALAASPCFAQIGFGMPPTDLRHALFLILISALAGAVFGGLLGPALQMLDNSFGITPRRAATASELSGATRDRREPSQIDGRRRAKRSRPRRATRPPSAKLSEGLRRAGFSEDAVADSDGSRPRFRDDVARHSDLISLGIPR